VVGAALVLSKGVRFDAEWCDGNDRLHLQDHLQEKVQGKTRRNIALIDIVHKYSPSPTVCKVRRLGEIHVRFGEHSYFSF